MAKSYDAGFHWSYGHELNFKESDPYGQCLIISDLFNYFRSDDFLARVKKFTGGKDFVCYSFSLNRTYSGSEVLPHKDSFKEDDPGADFFNITLFVDGTGGKNSGGLTFSRDNEL